MQGTFGKLKTRQLHAQTWHCNLATAPGATIFVARFLIGIERWDVTASPLVLAALSQRPLRVNERQSCEVAISRTKLTHCKHMCYTIFLVWHLHPFPVEGTEANDVLCEGITLVVQVHCTS